MRIRSLTTRLITWVLGATLVVSVVTFYIGFVENRQKLQDDANQTAEFAARALVNDISALIRGIEQAGRTLGSVVRHVRPDPDQSRALLHSLIEADPAIYGAAIAYAPEAFIAGTDFAAYMFRSGDGLQYVDVVAQDPGFRNKPWYRVPALTGKATWSEPYLDADLSGIDMVTFSIPVYEDLDSGPRLLAVVTADVALGSQRERIKKKSKEFGDDIRVTILSREGRIITVDSLDTQLSRDVTGIYTIPLAEYAAERGREDVRVLAERMVQGEHGSTTLIGIDRETRQWVHFRPLAATGWSVAVIVEEAELLEAIEASELREIALFALNLFLVAMVVVMLARRITGPLRTLATAAREIGHDPLAAKVPVIATRDEVGDLGEALRRMQVDIGNYVDELKATVDAKQRLEGELSAARHIQMAMLPSLPVDGEFADGCDVAATLIPAKAVGGDLFDLIPLADGRLLFLVGDVSDKGAAAALFMAKTVSLANLLGRDGVAPADLLDRLNQELCRDNDACMFVTALCGVLDPASGEVVYANAGHNAPLRFGSDGQAAYIDMPPGTMLGVFEEATYREMQLQLHPGETLLLYTDGVTEASNIELELFGDDRLEAFPGGLFGSSLALVKGVVEAVEAFAGEAEQADDITVLALRRTETGSVEKVYEMRGGIEALADVQVWLETELREAGIGDDLAGELQLVAEEVLANVVHHAHHDLPDAAAEIILRFDPDEVALQFSDSGPAFDPLQEAPEPDLDLPTEERPIGGLGVLLCKRLADRIEYRREAERNILLFVKRRSPG
jgi:sigma-B regulation protein RsbU (phosphoserine phosphatase)